MLFLSSLLLFYFNQEIYILLKKRIKKKKMSPVWLLFGAESFLKPSKVTALRLPHTWLFLMEAPGPAGGLAMARY